MTSFNANAENVHSSADIDSIDTLIEGLIASSQAAQVRTSNGVNNNAIITQKKIVNFADQSADRTNLLLEFDNTDDKLTLITRWKKDAIFPNPPKSGEYSSPIYKYSQDGVSINSTKDYIEIKAKNYATLINAFPYDSNGFGASIPIFSNTGFIYPNIKMDYYSYTVRFSLSTLHILDNFGWSGIKEEGDKASWLEANTASVIGYRIGQGELKPILHDSTYYDYKELLDADVFTIYAKAGAGEAKLATAAIYVDKPQGLVRAYRRHAFPSK
ncbi:hypothetical protein [Moraxella canis]|uniref:Uncharacterized protein n=1 Tax=Moraxella canis TaxID=90239 RepID=A0A1S9ZK61_9GAMM|nr:hypothetical protein [Moraxella canis]OOR83915.1 hypothetical protein B0180_05600 [Moraxella canis]